MLRREPYAILVSSLGSAMVSTEVKSLRGVMGTEVHDRGSCCYMRTIAGGLGQQQAGATLAGAGVNACAGSSVLPRRPLGVRGVTGGGALSC
jgi:hypothetical protein